MPRIPMAPMRRCRPPSSRFAIPHFSSPWPLVVSGPALIPGLAVHLPANTYGSRQATSEAPMANTPAARTVRELGGEIWAEVEMRSMRGTLPHSARPQPPEWIDIVMGVLARHIGSLIRNDTDLPVSA